MSLRVPACLPRSTAAALVLLFGAGPAAAQPPGASPPVAQPPGASPPVEATTPPPMPDAPPPLMPLTAPLSEHTDHDTVVGRWGVEARQVAIFDRTLRQESGCDETCPVALDSLGVRHWSRSKYAWSAGLAFAVGGGSSRRGGVSYSWD